MQLREGQRISAPCLAEIAEVKRFEPKPGYYLLEDQLAAIQILEHDRVTLSDNKERFQTSFVIVDRARFHSSWGENV